MNKLSRDKIREIISENHIIKFFDDITPAQNLLNKGEMLFNTLEHFAKLEQVGRGDITETIFKCSGTLYYKNTNSFLYDKLLDFNHLSRDKNRPIYCYTELKKKNFLDNGSMYLDREMLVDLRQTTGKLYGVVFKKDFFENKIINYFKKLNVSCEIGSIFYTDEEVDLGMIIDAQLGKSNLAYFRKPTKYKEQQERRIMIGEYLDELIKLGIAEKFKDGGKIFIEDLSFQGKLFEFTDNYNS